MQQIIFKKGDVVEMISYGRSKQGVVRFDQTSAIVQIVWDNGTFGWANAISLVKVGKEEVLRWLLTRVKHNDLKLCRGSQMYNYPMFLSTFNDQKEWVIL